MKCEDYIEMNKLQELVVDMPMALDDHNKIVSALENYIPVISTNTYAITSTTCIDDISCNYHRDIVYIHKTNCPNCGGLLDGDEHSPYVKCECCGAKIWSEREVS